MTKELEPIKNIIHEYNNGIAEIARLCQVALEHDQDSLPIEIIFQVLSDVREKISKTYDFEIRNMVRLADEMYQESKRPHSEMGQ